MLYQNAIKGVVNSSDTFAAPYICKKRNSNIDSVYVLQYN